jgi:hypothetical protein
VVWEAALVLVGGVAVLLRLGNAWLDGFMLVWPLAMRLRHARPPRLLAAALYVACVSGATALLLMSRPPRLPSAAFDATLAANADRAILSDWRWAGELQRRAGATRAVRGSGGLSSEPTDFWLDYLRVSQAHARWESILVAYEVDLIVLDAAERQRAAADVVRASPAWRVVFDADGALVAARSSP